MSETMRAIQVTEFGGPEVLKLVEVPVPDPGDDGVLVKQVAAGINYADVYQREGRSGGTPPFIIGREGAGTVVAVGRNVSGVAVGDLVSYRGPKPGGFSEYVVASPNLLFKVPDGISPLQATAIQVQGMTAHYLSHDVFEIKEGHTCLVHAGAGGVGHILIQIAKAKGATVFTTVGSAEKADLSSSYGADEVILYREQDFAEIILEKTDGEGVNVVYDAIGKTTIEGSIKSVGFQGTVALYGDASGQTPPVDTKLLGEKCSYLTRVGLPHFTRSDEEVARRCSDLVDLIKAGKLNLNIAEPWPLEKAAEAFAALEGRQTTGKQILQP